MEIFPLTVRGLDGLAVPMPKLPLDAYVATPFAALAFAVEPVPPFAVESGNVIEVEPVPPCEDAKGKEIYVEEFGT
jgi:hypothetical protein